MKLKRVFITLGLAATMGFGAFTGIKASKIEVKEAKAAATRLYLDMSAYADWYSSSASFKVHTWNSAKGDQYHAVTKVANAYYYADVDLATYASGGGYRFTRYKSDFSEKWNEGAWNTYADGVNTYYRPSGWTAGTWSTEDQKTWSIVGATNGVWAGGDEDINIPLTFRFNSEGLSFYNTTVNLTAGSVFKVKNSTNNYYGFDCIEDGEGSAARLGDVTGQGGSNITVAKSGSYEVYMKPFAAKFWIQENSAASALAFAETFLEKTDAVCKDSSKGVDTDLSSLQAIWNAVENDGVDQLVELWNHLTTGAKTEFKNSSNATIVAARARYVQIMGRYGSPTLTAFANGPSYSNVVNPLSTITETKNVAIIIVVISTLSLVALGGFFFIKRRKESK